MASAKIRASINAGAAVEGGIDNVPSAAAVSFSFANTSGWASYTTEILGPPGWAIPAGWTTVDADGCASYSGVTAPPPGFNLPAAAAGWGKWSVRNFVTLGDGTILVDDTLLLSMPSPHGLEDVAARELGQFSRLRSWARGLQKSLRILETFIAAGGGNVPAGPAGGSLGGNYPNPTVAQLDGSGGVANLRAATVDWSADGASTHGAVSYAPTKTTLSSGSATTLATIAMPASSLYDFSFRVTLRKPDGTSYAASLVATYKRVASGAPVIVGAAVVTSRSDAGAIAWIAAYVISGNNILLQVTAENTVVVTFEGAYLRNS